MQWAEFLYLLPYLVSLGLSLWVLLFASRWRGVQGINAFIWYTGGGALWILGFILELVSPALSYKIFWDSFQWLAGLIFLLAFPVFVIQYTGYKLQRPIRTWWFSTIIPILFATLVLTDKFHHLIYSNPSLQEEIPFGELKYDFTGVVYAYALYAYLISFAVIAILTRRFLHSHQLYRAQVATIAVGYIIPVLGTILTLAGIQYAPQRDASPLTFAIGNLVVAWGLFRYRIFDIGPIARDTVIENMSDLVIVLDSQNRILDFNPIALRILEKKSSELLGQPAERIFAEWPQLLNEFSSPQDQNIQNTLFANGQNYHYEVNSTILHNKQGEYLGRVFVARDITAHVELQNNLQKLNEELEQRVSERTEELQKSVERYRAVVENQTEFIVRWRPNGTRTFANEAYCRYWGLTYEQALTVDFLLHIAEEDKPAVIEKIVRLCSGTVDTETEIHRITKPDGSMAWQEWTDHVIRDMTGQIVEIQSVGRDITERKQAERAVHESETRYRTLVEQIPPIIYISDPDQRIGVTYISPRIETLGFRQEEWVADPQLWFRQIHPEDQKRVLAEIKRDEQSGKPFNSEYRLVSRDGQIRWFLDEAMNIEDQDGSVLFRQGFMLDITERKQVEESLSARERYLNLLNEMTRSVLLSKDFDSTLHRLAESLAKLMHADDCYIARWDEERQKAIPVATTATMGRIYSSYRDAQSRELKMVLSVLKAGHALAADDVYDSPYVDLEFVKSFPIRSGLGIPLIAGEHKLGAAVIAFSAPHHFTADEIEQAEQAGNQIALALWNFQQRIEIKQRLKESNTLAKTERALSESERIGTGEVLQLIVDSARELMPNAQKSVIHLLEAKENVLLARAVSGYDGQEKEGTGIKMQVGEGVAGKVFQQGITVNVPAIQEDPDFLLKDSAPDFRSLLVAPVQRSGQQIGTISIQSSAENAFSTKDAELLNALAVQAAIAIENTRLFETTQQSLKEVNILYQISRRLAASLNANQLIRDMISLVQQSLGYYHVQIYLIDPQTRNLVVRHGSGYIGNELVNKGHHIPAGEGIVGHVAETREIFMTNNVKEVEFYRPNPLLSQTQFEIAIPIKIDEEVLGVLDIQQTPDHRKFANSDLYLMTAIADQLAVVLQKANLYSTLQISLQQEKKMRSQLLQSERLALVGRLLASVSHELNNPLQAIQYGLFLLRDEANLSDQARQDIDVLIGEMERMTALIERLRSAYRPVRLQDFQSIPLNSLIEDVHALISTYMRHNEIAFQFMPDSGLPGVLALPDQIRQVILNLFLNAIEVMQPGGCLTVETSSLLEQKEVLILVKDTGPGIDPEIMPNIFDAFITNKQTGSGLGLTITHDIIQQHHGRIEAENNPEGGATFKVWLPTEERG